MLPNKKVKGITLIEMLIAVVILCIIIMVAAPSYMSYLRKSRRAEATIALLDIATRMERYYAENNHSYNNASMTSNLGLASTTTSHGYYTLSLASLSANTYTLEAAPAAETSQTADSVCGNFTFTQTGKKGITGTGKASACWGS